MNKILFIGSNPSRASLDSAAFNLDTSSRRVLDSWLRDLRKELSLVYCNVSSIKTPNNRPLTVSEIKQALPILAETIKKYSDYKLVALGKTAAKALTLLHVDFYAMPHPSGRNRKLNDKAYIKEKIKGLEMYLESQLNLELCD